MELPLRKRLRDGKRYKMCRSRHENRGHVGRMKRREQRCTVPGSSCLRGGK